MEVKIKKAIITDVPIILDLIKGIAEYEKLLDQVETTKELLKQQLFEEKNAFVYLAYVNKKPVGFALYFYNFSTFKGRKGLYLEDLFVLPEYRSKGIGEQLFNTLIKEAKTNNCGRMEWVCLNWNEPAINFYKKKKAKSLDNWIIFRLDENNF
ncbi:MAG: N-acetyltransferase [Tenericutes bacterium 4572_104]|nr:MAG: N-acetyltransferase [Tenericutes bacterium 4572_104]